jgi:adenosylcobinamide-GDP ribazoletransferase
MKKFLIALQFLTVLPVRIRSKVTDEDFRSVFAYFPLAGACIGLVLAVLAAALGVALPQLALAACVLAAYTIMTGALHLDGLADTCDGLFSGKPRDKILEIMRDSHIGTFGAVGVCTVLVLKFAFLASLPQVALWKMLILVPVFSRWTQGLVCSQCRYARSDGKANLFFQYATTKDAVIGGVFSLALFTILLGAHGLVVCFVALLPVVGFILSVDKTLGGMTGDTVGATSEIAEVSLLFFSLVL